MLEQLKAGDSYDGRPIREESVWEGGIPFYFLTSGIAGASSVLGLAARTVGNDRAARASLFVGFSGDVVSSALLSDLGRPRRFPNGVFKVTFPTKAGAWILAASGAANGLAVLLELGAKLPRVKLLAETVSAVLGPPLATSTAVLISDTAVPAWHEARRELPFVFAGSSAAAAGALACVFLRPEDARPARGLAVLGTAAEGAGMQLLERRLAAAAAPYREGVAGTLATAAKGLSTAGAALLGIGGRKRRSLAVAGGLMLVAGEACLRWSVLEAGCQSARDQRSTVEPRREGRREGAGAG